MRELTVYNRSDAEKELRADEELLPCGGIDHMNFFCAVSDESFLSKEERLLLRRQKRKEKK